MTISVDRRLVGKKEAARLCGIGVSTFDRYRQLGWVPQAVVLGNILRWRLSDLEDWIAAGCPREKPS